MRIEPNYFSECPATDTLSLLLADIHMEGGSYIFAELASPWAFHIHTPNVACFHIVLSGQAWLKLDDDSAILLKTGELVILPLGTSHTMYARYGDAVKAINLEKLIHTHASKHSRFLKAGGHGETTEMICGYFKFDMSLARPLLQSLPPILHIPNHTGYMRDWLNIGISFMISETKQQRVAHQAIVNRICDLLFIECMREYVENLDVNSDSWLSALKVPISCKNAKCHSSLSFLGMEFRVFSQRIWFITLCPSSTFFTTFKTRYYGIFNCISYAPCDLVVTLIKPNPCPNCRKSRL